MSNSNFVNVIAHKRLVNAVVEQIYRDASDEMTRYDTNDWTAIAGLLWSADPKLLQDFLKPEEEQHV